MVWTVEEQVISPLRQLLDLYAKTCLKMCHMFKRFIHMQYFLLLTNLVIVFVHWISTCVLYELRHFSLFWDYIPESLTFLRQSVSPFRSVFNPTNTEVAQLSNNDAQWLLLMGSNQKQRCGSEFAKWHDIYAREKCADEWRQNNTDLKLLEKCVMNGFIMFSIMFMTANGLENSPQSVDVYTVSQSHSVVTSTENTCCAQHSLVDPFWRPLEGSNFSFPACW